MPASPVRLRPEVDAQLEAALAALPAALGIDPAYPAAAVAEAERAVADVELPDDDATDLDLVTIDPPGSLDLDQALAIDRDGGGWIVHYAIADVAAFIAPGGELDAETRRRGQTLYAAEGRIPLHPDVLGEDAASLLPDRIRGAYLWRLRLDADGALVDTVLRRARVRSTARLDYAGVQAEIDAGRAGGSLALLPEVGAARQAQELARGGASLNRPETIVERRDGGIGLVRRIPLAVERWNAQLSLLTGMAAARLMLDGGVGILRTMPPADAESVDRFRRQTRLLGTTWPDGQPYGAYLAALDPTDGGHLAILHAAGALFRGAGYAAFDRDAGVAPPEQVDQAALGAPYAHVTAPIRRLVDRFALQVCAALSAGGRPADEVRDALPDLLAIMQASGSLASRLDRMTVDTVEAAVLAPRVGEVFEASVISSRAGGGVIQLVDPPVTADCDAPAGEELRAGSDVRARLATADVSTAEVRFAAEPRTAAT